MPIAPRVTRGQTRPGHDRTDHADPIPVLLVLRWQGVEKTELVPGHRVADTGFPGRPAEAHLCRWWWDYGGEMREDWFRAGDVLDHQPTDQEWRDLVQRPPWMS